MSNPQSSIKMLRAASLRPVSSQLNSASRAFLQARRLESQSSGPSNPPGTVNRKPSQAQGEHQGPTGKAFKKEGSGSNTTLIYYGVGALGLGGLYAFFMGRPDKVIAKAEEHGIGPTSDKAKRYPKQS